jgi:catechol 2,3-dioxygenase-like lactoylglutathione lyase family enzyme
MGVSIECTPMHMLHHLSLPVTDIARSARFYNATLSALGYIRVWAHEHGVGYGSPGGGDKFAIKLSQVPVGPPGPGFHVAFAAASREVVANFHAAGIENGGKDNGPAGRCPHYGENYYAAFVMDPDGYQVEAVINSAV